MRHQNTGVLCLPIPLTFRSPVAWHRVTCRIIMSKYCHRQCAILESLGVCGLVSLALDSPPRLAICASVRPATGLAAGNLDPVTVKSRRVVEHCARMRARKAEVRVQRSLVKQAPPAPLLGVRTRTTVHTQTITGHEFA